MSADELTFAILTVVVALLILFALAYVVIRVIRKHSKRSAKAASRTIPVKERPEELRMVVIETQPDIEQARVDEIEEAAYRNMGIDFHKDLDEFRRKNNQSE